MRIIVEEIKKLKREKYCPLFLSFLIILAPVATVALYKLSDGNMYFGSNVVSETPFKILNILFLSNHTAIGIIISIVLSYFLLSKEYIYESWDLLLTKINNKFNLIGSKFCVFYLYYSVSSIFSYILFLLITKSYLGINIDFTILPNSLCIILFLNMIMPTLQFLIHLRIPSGITATALSVIWFLLISIYQFVPLFLQKIIPFYYTGVILQSNLILNNGQLYIYSLICIVTSVLLIAIGSKNFYK